MAGSSIGTIFRITTWGETHGEGLGVVVDGCPAGLSITQEEIQQFLNRRKPGQSKYTTPRKEDDQVEILSGIFEGKTTGTPISMVVYNRNQKSKDYSQIKDIYRPGHADYTYDAKYGIRDYRGGGRSSGRETIGRVAAGAVASKLLEELGITISTYAREIGGISIDTERFQKEEIFRNPFYMPDKEAAAHVQEYADRMMKEKDSMGGVIECVVDGLKPGIGDPVFEKLDANLAKAILSIGAVKGFEIGDGFAAASSNGSVNNDAYCWQDGRFIKKTNHSGGVLGGISDGSPLVFRAAVKPTPSIAKIQSTAGKDGEEIELSVKGRHDPMIVPRAVVVVESMAAVTVADGLLRNMSASIDSVKKIYE